MSRARDQHVADDAMTDRQSMCVAHGCPNRWSVDAGNGRLCSAHAWAETSRWPEITQVQQWNLAELARLSAEPKPAPRTVDRAKLRAWLLKLAERVRSNAGGNKGWAEALRAREDGGERLTEAQRAMWRQALGHVPQSAFDDRDAA